MRRPILLAVCVAAFAAGDSDRLVKKMSFGAAEGGREHFDYVGVDSGVRRAYLSHGAQFLVVNL